MTDSRTASDSETPSHAREAAGPTINATVPLGGLERGERNLTLRSMERLADKLDVPALELLVAKR